MTTDTAPADADFDPDDIDPSEAAIALDLLLTEAALGMAHKFQPRTAMFRMGISLAKKPQKIAKRSAEFGTELAKVATGKSAMEPARGDRRFPKQAGWQDNPVLKRVMQSYLAAGKTANDLLEDAELSYEDSERAEFLISIVNDALAPTNNPALNPVAWDAMKQTKGKSAIRGVKAAAKDMRHAPRLPSMIEDDAFEVGVNLATTPGAVVYRSEVFELIQYNPSTEKVYKHPLVFIPPMINKFYAVDLAPNRSMVEYLLSRGQQCFVMSWRNPKAEHRAWNFDSYGNAIIEALTAAREITGSPKANLYGACSGGMVTTMVLAHLKAEGRLDEVSGLSLSVAVLDQSAAGLASSMLTEETAAAAIAISQAKGYLDGRHLAEAFAWLRPNDLIWSYWINNYLMGRKPPKFDVLYWNADTTRMAAGLHKDFVQVGLGNKLATPGAAKMLGTPVDVKTIDVDSYIVAGVSDHICPWSACYATTQMLGGKVKFVLSSSGHIASIVNPPGNPRSKYMVGESNPDSAEVWYENATTKQGSWWPDFASWLSRRGGGKVDAPAQLGSDTYPPMEPAPGLYIYEP